MSYHLISAAANQLHPGGRQRRGLTAHRATQLLLLYGGTDVYGVLVHDFRWTHDAWVDWTVATLKEQLFGPAPRRHGLAFDLETLVGRRQLLKMMGRAGIGAGMFVLAACVPSASSSSAEPSASVSLSGTASPTNSPTASQSAAASEGASASCETIPEETAGPYPGDGSNGPNMLTEGGIVRSDIRSSFGSASGVADGVPLDIRLIIQDQANGCDPLAGAAVYLWHCDREGRYSLYSNGVTNENYLRGVQEADADGVVTFESIFPGCYSGRWPHIHFEVYRSFDRDNVFGEDGGARQLGAVTGSVDAGYVVELVTPVNAA